MPIDGLPVTVQMQRFETAVTKWVINDLISRAGITLNNTAGGSDLVLEAGTVLGQRTVSTAVGSVTAAADGGNTGNGTLTPDGTAPVQAGAQLGIYKAVCILGGATPVFAVFDPNGLFLGHVAGGGTFNNQVKFAIADGGTNFAAGDFFTVTTSAGDGTYVQLNASASDGSNVAAAILYARAFVAAGTNDDGAALIREAAVVTEALIWPNGFSAAQIAAATAQLLKQRLYTVPRV